MSPALFGQSSNLVAVAARSNEEEHDHRRDRSNGTAGDKKGSSSSSVAIVSSSSLARRREQNRLAQARRRRRGESVLFELQAEVHQLRDVVTDRDRSIANLQASLRASMAMNKGQDVNSFAPRLWQRHEQPKQHDDRLSHSPPQQQQQQQQQQQHVEVAVPRMYSGGPIRQRHPSNDIHPQHIEPRSVDHAFNDDDSEPSTIDPRPSSSSSSLLWTPAGISHPVPLHGLDHRPFPTSRGGRESLGIEHNGQARVGGGSGSAATGPLFEQQQALSHSPAMTPVSLFAPSHRPFGLITSLSASPPMSALPAIYGSPATEEQAAAVAWSRLFMQLSTDSGSATVAAAHARVHVREPLRNSDSYPFSASLPS